MAETLARLNAALHERYHIERELGAGGMATVYLAHDTRHDRKVALKLLRPELSAILGGERFLAEIKTTANLQHPHILSLYDSGEADGLVYYVMPYVEGESLRDRLTREKQLPVDEAVRIAREVADALDYAHRKGVVHRDIKPENILLQEGRALVADFGIALAVSRSDGGTRMTETGMSLGTPHYMSPEQAMGEREITPKADVYALGCVLYEMLTGEPPYTGPTAQAIIARVMTEEPRSLTLQRRTIPPHVESAVQVALAKLPADRFATAAQFADALAGTATALPVTRMGTAARAAARATPLWKRALPWASVAIAAAIGAWGWLRPLPRPTVLRQRITIWKAPLDAGTISIRAAIAPDGNTIVYVDTAGGVQQLFAKDRDRLEPTLLAGTAGALGPVFSPDGQWIAFAADGKLKKIPRQGGSAITVADSANTFLPAIAWLESDTILYNTPAWDLMIVGAAGGSPRKVVAVDSIGRGVVTASALPGGRGALLGVCTFGCPERDLRVLDLRSGRLKPLGDDIVKAWYLADGGVLFVRKDGGAFRAPFSLDTLGFSAPPAPVLDGVRIGFVPDLVLSPAGTLLYAAGTGQGTAPVEAVWVGRDGRAARVDSGWAFVPSANQGMALSPDGTRLAISIRTGSSEDIWIKQLDHGPLTRLTFQLANARPVWSPDGRSVYFISARPGSGGLYGSGDLHVRLADGTGTEDTVVHLSRPVWEFVPTGDTARYLVRLGSPPTRDIVLARRGDTTFVPLVADPGFNEVGPTLSPDGRWLAYASDESGRYEIYVRPWPDVGAGRWQVSRNGGSEAQWAHSGRELFYRSAADSLISVAIRPGPSFSLGDQRALFATDGYWGTNTYRYYAVSPDDSRFLFARNVGSQDRSLPDLVLVEHWFTELNARR